MDPIITLAISGNQFRHAGFAPLVSIRPQFRLEYSAIPGVERSARCYEITTAMAFTQYTMLVNKVFTNEGEKAVLKIAIGIPQGYRVSNGNTPYHILMNIYSLFVERYMRPKLGVEGGLQFKSDQIDPTIFTSVLMTYRLEPANVPHRVMRGTAPALLILPEEKVASLMADVMYPEFTQYKSVIVAPVGDEAMYPGRVLSNIEVPRKPKYALIVNSTPQKWPVADIFNETTSLSTNANSPYYDDASVRFSVNMLLAGQRVPGVTLDTLNEQVLVSLRAKAKEKYLKVIVAGCKNPKNELAKMQFFLEKSNKFASNAAHKTQLFLTGDSLHLVGEQIGDKISVKYDSEEYSLENPDQQNNLLKITLKSKNTNVVTHPSGNNNSYEGNITTAPVELTLTFDKENLSSITNGQPYVVVTNSSKNKLLKEYVQFNPSASATTVQLPYTWAGESLNVKFVCGNKVSYKQSISTKSGNNNVTMPAFTTDSDKNIVRIIVALVALVLVSIFIGWLCFKHDSGKEEEPQEEAIEAVQDSIQSPEDILAEWAAKHSDRTLSFSQVREFNTKISSSEMQKYRNEHPESTPAIEEIRTYMEVANAVDAHNIEAIKDICNSKDKKRNLDPYHLNCLTSIFKGYIGDDNVLYEYQADQLDLVKDEFMRTVYPDFSSLTKLRDNKRTNPKQEGAVNTPANNASNNNAGNSGNSNAGKGSSQAQKQHKQSNNSGDKSKEKASASNNNNWQQSAD